MFTVGVVVWLYVNPFSASSEEDRRVARGGVSAISACGGGILVQVGGPSPEVEATPCHLKKLSSFSFKRCILA